MSRRLFIAVDLPPAQLIDLGTPLRELEELKRGKVPLALVPVENIHLTLKFLGSTEEDQIPAILETLQGVAARASRIELSLGERGVFPRIESPRVLWVGVLDPTDALKALAQELNGRLESLGFAREEKPFIGHLTLARVKESGAKGEAKRQIGDWVRGASEPAPGSKLFSVSELVLYESKTLPCGAVYMPMKRMTFETK
jgi:2'-5' RNA ligase